MTDTVIELTWATDTKGFHIPGNVDLNERDTIPLDERIVRNGGPLQEYLPAKIETLLDEFLLVRTPADLLRFVNLRGPLTREGFYCEASEEDFRAPNEFYSSTDKGEALDVGLDNSGWFRNVLQAKQKPSRVARSFST